MSLVAFESYTQGNDKMFALQAVTFHVKSSDRMFSSLSINIYGDKKVELFREVYRERGL